MMRGMLSAYSKRKQQVLVAFQISKQGELKNLGHWKLRVLFLFRFLSPLGYKPFLL